MPIPPPAIPLFLLHPLHPSPASAYAARAGASTLLATALARDLYRRTPEWIRQDDVWKSLLETEEGGEGHKDEMASLTAVIQKLQGLIVTGYEKLGSERRRMRRRRTARSSSSKQQSSRRLLRKSTSECLCQTDGSLCQSCTLCRSRDQSMLDSSVTNTTASSDPITPLEWHAALLAYIQLSNQMKERYPSWRDQMYEVGSCEEAKGAPACQFNSTNEDEIPDSSLKHEQFPNENNMSRNETNQTSNHHNPITTSEIKELKRMLDYAVWAYEPDEEVLRNLLQADRHIETEANSDGSLQKEPNSNETGGYQLLVHRTTSYIESSSDATTSQYLNKSKSSKKLRKPPGRVGYYVAISHVKKELLMGLKGTSTLEDILTDCCGRALRLDLDYDPHHPAPSTCEISPEELLLDDSNSIGESNSRTCNDGLHYLLDSQKDEILHVSLIDNQNDVSNLEEIEVNLVEADLFHRDESNETSITLQHEVQHNTNNPSGLSDNQESPRKRSDVNLSIASAPHPVENILLFPSNQNGTQNSLTNTITHTIEDDVKLLAAAESSHEDALESHGIEMEPARTTKLRGVHEGLVHCAQQLFSEIYPLIEEFAVSKGYDVVCTGHSMGAGTSALLALLIRGKYPTLVVPYHSNDTKRVLERVRVYAFAPPPVMDRSSALACRHYVTSIVNNSDIIPRSSLTNLDILLTMLEAVRNRLVDFGMNPGSTKSDDDVCQKPKNVIASIIALVQKLSEGTEGELLMEPAELRQVWDEAVADASLGEDGIYWDFEGDHHLFVPGNVLMLHKPWYQLENNRNQIEDTAMQQPFYYKTVWTNGTSPMLKGFEVGAGGNMVTDHLTSSYYKAFECLENSLISSSDTEPSHNLNPNHL